MTGEKQTVDLETLRLIRDLAYAITDDKMGIEARGDAQVYLRTHCPCPPEERANRSYYNKMSPYYCVICGKGFQFPPRLHLVVKR